MLAGSAAWAKAPPAWVQSNNQRRFAKAEPRGDGPMEPATRLRSLGKTIELRVGEKQSFRSVHMAGVVDPKVARIVVDEGVLTIRGLEPGDTTLQLFGSGVPTPDSVAKPREVRVSVK